jgi:hypothetical protein
VFRKEEPIEEPSTRIAIKDITNLINFLENDFFGKRNILMTKGIDPNITENVHTTMPDELRLNVLLLRLRKILSD